MATFIIFILPPLPHSEDDEGCMAVLVFETKRRKAYSSLCMVQFHASGEPALGEQAQLGNDKLIDL